MDEMALSRSKSKHPPAKVAVEAQRIKSKVEKSDTNRRSNMTRNTAEAQTRQKLTADLPKMERFIEDLDKQAAVTNTGTPEMRLSGARLLEAEALRLAQDDGADYSHGMRRAVGVVDVPDGDVDDRPARRLGDAHHGSDEELEKIVNERMNGDKENYA